MKKTRDHILLEGDECIVDFMDPNLVIRAPEVVRTQTFEHKGKILQRFQGSIITVGVLADTPEEAITHCGAERE
jgi:hypothetical protein